MTKKGKPDLGAKMKQMRGRQFVARARSLPTRTILTPLTRQSRTLDTTPPDTTVTPFRTRHTDASSGTMAAPLGMKPASKTRGKPGIACRIRQNLQRIRGTLWPPPPKPSVDIKVSPARPQAWLPSAHPIKASAFAPPLAHPTGAQRPGRQDWTRWGGLTALTGLPDVGKIAPHSGDLMASPAQAIIRH